ENTSIYVQIEGIFAIENIPQSSALTYYLSIYDNNGSKIESGTITAPNGEILTYYLNGIEQGYYSLQVYFTTNGENCSPITTNFLVSPPPVPYTALFLSNGEFIFHSDMLNTTGKANQSYPFQVTISYQFPGGSSQTVGVFNTTNMTFTPSNEGETVVVNVMDKWGWLNSAGVNIQQDIFSGPPLTYTFGNVPNPYGSVWFENVIGDVMIIVFLLGTIYYFVRRSSSKRVIEDVYE
ncbi:MAG: hypothetical protein M1163_01410, partial [Candidatus Thermoplasmatota archaeon]|nr:hypothetical protein [Candidatus Thermoplasmatota archaeon]